MRYLTFTAEEHSSYEICFLVNQLNQEEINKHYLSYFPDDKDKILAYNLHQEGKKTPVKVQKEYLNTLLPVLMELGVKYLVTCDAEYFKTLTKAKKVNAVLGYVMDIKLDGFKDSEFKVIYCPNFTGIFYDPEKVQGFINQALSSLALHRAGSYQEPGNDVIKFAEYPKTVEEIRTWLLRLLEMDVPLTCDIEGFSLKHHSAGIGTITFCWNQHEGIAFPVDFHEESHIIRDMLIEFFENFKQKILWHNISYDVYVLVYQLFMDHLLDTKGLLYGLQVLLRNWHCTKLITYLATNSCAGNKLGLKDQAQEFAGNYAVEEIKDITQIPLDDLLQYNLVDGLSTWYVYNKHWDTLVHDNQLDIYENLFQPAIVDIIQMQLTGLPLDMDAVIGAKETLEDFVNTAVSKLQAHPAIDSFNYWLCEEEANKKNSKWKVKRTTADDIYYSNEAKVFNPNSGPQLQTLLYDEQFMGLPVIDYTDTKLPSTGAETIEKLKNHTEDPDNISFLDALIDYISAIKILNTFIPAFLAAPKAPDGWHYLFGNFNLGGTLSGRLSSNKPNLQNLPSTGTRWAKLIKSCFKAPPGWLFVGIDFSSLEDRISAVTTKDPNKLKVYTDGYDGHCLRAYSYFQEEMPDILEASSDEECFSAILNDKEVYFSASEKVEYLGKIMTGKELYSLLKG